MVGACGLDRCYSCQPGAGDYLICVNDPNGTLTTCSGNPCGGSGGGGGSGGCSQVCDTRCYGTDLYNRRCNTSTGSCVQDTLNRANAPECGGGGGSGNVYTVNMTIIGNGTVTVSSSTRGTEYLTSSGSQTYSQFDEIHYNAVGASGYQFTSFNVDGNVTTLPNFAISVLNSNKNITVTFTKIATGAIVLNGVEWATPTETLSKIRLYVTTNGSTSTYLKVDADSQKTLVYSSTATTILTTDVYTTAIPHDICIGTPSPTQCKNLAAIVSDGNGGGGSGETVTINVWRMSGAGEVSVYKGSNLIGKTSNGVGSFTFQKGDTFKFAATAGSGWVFDKYCSADPCSGGASTTSNPFTDVVRQNGNLYVYFKQSGGTGGGGGNGTPPPTKYYRCDSTNKKCVEDSTLTSNKDGCTYSGQTCGGTGGTGGGYKCSSGKTNLGGLLPECYSTITVVLVGGLALYLLTSK